jgi:hypothetical protein
VQHVNDSGDDRVIVLTRFAPSRRVTDRDAPPPPVRLGSIVTDGAEAVLLFNFGPRRYKSGYRCGAPRAGFWAPVLDTGMLLRSVLPQLLAHLGAVEGGARDGGNGRVVDAARADLAGAISRALVGLRPRTPDGVAAIALDAMQTMLSEAHKAGPPYAPWCWGGQTLAERGCYGDGNEGFPFSILCERLEPFSARVYVRVSPCPPAAAAVDGSGSGSPRSALQWSCVSCTLRNESDAAACAVCLLPRP